MASSTKRKSAIKSKSSSVWDARLWIVNSPFLLDSPSVLMAASEMTAGYVTRKESQRGTGKLLKSILLPRFLESWIFCHISWAFYVSKFPGTSSEIDDSWSFLSILINSSFCIEKVNVIRTNPLLILIKGNQDLPNLIKELAFTPSMGRRLFYVTANLGTRWKNEVAESNVMILYKFFLSKAYLIASNACSYLSLTLPG